jgi:DnaK suppressor protein
MGYHMNKKDLKHYKETLLLLKTQILNSGILKSKEDLTISSDDLSEEGDLASVTINQELSFGIREWELEKLRAIENALYRIEEGSYGHCEECDQEIKAKRLEKQPWATLCIDHAEERERENQRFSKAG